MSKEISKKFAPESGKDVIKSIKQDQKARKQEALKPWLRFMERMVFGLGSLITSGIAGFAVWKYLHLSGVNLWVACVAIAITLTPAVLATGRYIIQGALSEARK